MPPWWAYMPPGMNRSSPRSAELRKASGATVTGLSVCQYSCHCSPQVRAMGGPSWLL